MKIDNEYKLSFIADAGDDYIKSLINSGVATYACEIDCDKTYFRKCVLEDSGEFCLEIPECYLYDTFNVTITVIAKTAINSYSNPNADEDFEGIGAFELSKGDIISYVFFKRYYLKDAKTVASFITIERDESKQQIDYDLNGSDIVIKMPGAMHDIFSLNVYRSNSTRKTYMPFVMASLINEALVYALLNITNETAQRPWAEAIQRWIESKFDDDLNIEDIHGEPKLVYDIAHSMLEDPMMKMFEQIKKKQL